MMKALSSMPDNCINSYRSKTQKMRKYLKSTITHTKCNADSTSNIQVLNNHKNSLSIVFID